MVRRSMQVVRPTAELSWQAVSDGIVQGTADVWKRPDARCSVFFEDCSDDAYEPLLHAIVADIGELLYVDIDAADEDGLARFGALGFSIWRSEGHYEVCTAPRDAGGVEPTLPRGISLCSAIDVNEDVLRALDDALRQDVPGSEGWKWDPGAFHDETFSAAFDPQTYLVALDASIGRHVGIARVWNNPSVPRLGLIAVLPSYRRMGIALAMCDAVFAVLHRRGVKHVICEVDDTNVASLALLGRFGARRIGGTLELSTAVHPHC